jgi:hypothetical protein
MEVVGNFLKSFKAQFQSVFLDCFRDMYSSLFYKQNATDIETLSAVCIFDDYVEHTGDAMLENGKSKILEELMKFCSHANADVR